MTVARMTFGVRGRLIAGFASLCLVLAITVAATVYAITQLSVTVGKVFDLRTPVAVASTQMVSQLYGTLSALRGYLLTGDPQGKITRAGMWAELDGTTRELERLAAGFGDQQNVQLWGEIRTLLGQFRDVQRKVEDVAFTPDAYPATRILTEQAAPLSTTIFGELTKMINIEQTLAATPERKRLLKTLADARGNFAAAVAQLRLYIVSGDKAERARYEQPSKTFKAAVASVTTQKDLLDAPQLVAFEAIIAAEKAYEPLTERIFALRDGAQWNMPVFLLATEAAPMANKLLDLLDGRMGPDGIRTGGLKTIQQAKLVTDSQSARREIDSLIVAQWILLAIGLVLGTIASLIVARSIIRPIADLVADARRLAAGDTSVAFHTARRRDEIGVVAGAVAKFRDNVIAQQQAAADFAAEVAEREALNDHMEQTVESFRAAAQHLLETVSSNSSALKQTAQTLTGIAGGASEQAVSAASASEETATSVQTVASAAEQLTSSIHEIGRQVERSTTTMRTASNTAAKSETEIDGLAAAAQRINSVVDLIQSIAAQTNLLALNATIEAARAGDAGRGFAIVAQEVKSLAGQTAKATEEISQQITAIQHSTAGAVASVKGVSAAMRDIEEVTSAIASAIEEQNSATREIARNVQMAASGTQTLAGNIAAVNSAIGATNHSADDVLGASTRVSTASHDLAEQVRAFFIRLREGPMNRRKADDPDYLGPERRDNAADRGASKAA